MSRRAVLTNRQRASLFSLPTDEATLLRHYILTDEDLAHIHRRRRPQNRLGFALQLCALRYPGRLLQPGETIPERMLAFIGAQLGLSGEALIDYGVREATRYQHSAVLQRLYGYRPFEGRIRDEVRHWLTGAAETARSNDALAAVMLEELRTRKIIVQDPAPSSGSAPMPWSPPSGQSRLASPRVSILSCEAGCSRCSRTSSTRRASRASSG